MTPRERAELYARVARRIGLPDPQTYQFNNPESTHHGEWMCVYDRRITPETSMVFTSTTFDPVANPADERRVRDYCDREYIGISEWRSTSHWYAQARGFNDTSHEAASAECRITALLLAIDALPEVEG